MNFGGAVRFALALSFVLAPYAGQAQLYFTQQLRWDAVGNDEKVRTGRALVDAPR